MANKKKPAKTDTKPHQEFNAVGQLALKAKDLAKQYETEIGTRLSKTFLDDFAEDITGLVAAVPAVVNTHDGVIKLTAKQAEALDNGYRLVKGFRATVKSHDPGKDVLLAFGVGTRLNSSVVKDVTAALQKCIDRIKAEPTEAAKFELVDDDSKALEAALLAIKDADKAQELGRATAPKTTKDRNATARRLLAGVKKIAGAGMRALVSNPTAYANFEALIKKVN